MSSGTNNGNKEGNDMHPALTAFPLLGALLAAGQAVVNHPSVPKPHHITATGYCSCKKCCLKYSPEVGGAGLTASGRMPQAERTLASRKLPIGTRVAIPGLGTRVVEDRGGPDDGGVDVYFKTHKEALEFGRRKGQLALMWAGDRPQPTAEDRAIRAAHLAKQPKAK